MQIKHEILSFNPKTGSITVRYFNDETGAQLEYNIDLPIENGAFVSQEKMTELIEAMKPVGQLERAAALNDVDIPSHLASLIPQQPVPSVQA